MLEMSWARIGNGAKEVSMIMEVFEEVLHQQPFAG